MSYFKFNDLNIYYEVEGSGFPLVILNGIMMSTKSWESLKQDFTSKHTLIRLDFIDQGQSDAAKEPYEQSIQVEVLKALLDHLKIQKTHLVGISYGGELGMQFIAKYPAHIEKAIIFNSVSYTTNTLATLGHKWNEYAKARDTLKYYEVTIPVIYSKIFVETHEAWMEARRNILINGPFANPNFLDRMIRLTDSALSYDVRPYLKDIKTPILIVGAEEDQLTPLVHQRYMADALPNASFVVLPGVGHASMYEVPHVFTSIIIGYLNTPYREYNI